LIKAICWSMCQSRKLLWTTFLGCKPQAVFNYFTFEYVNLWIHLKLSMSHFGYALQGILDHTYLRFFTRQALINLT
jgi:uncharacterized membrane protein YpjA